MEKQPLEIITIQEYDPKKHEKLDRNTSIFKYEVTSTTQHPNGSKSGTWALYSSSESGLFHSLALALEARVHKAKIEYGQGFEKDEQYQSLKVTFDVMLRHHNSLIDKIDILSPIPK